MYKIGHSAIVVVYKRTIPHMKALIYNFLETQQVRVSSRIVCHALMKISILYENLAYVPLPP